MNYEIDGDQKWLIRDGKRFASSEATDCEMELWAALQAAYSAGAEQMRERAAMVADEWSCRNSEEWARYKENIVDSIRSLPIGESSQAPQEKP